MGRFLFMLNITLFTFSLACFAESDQKKVTIDYEDDKIYSSSECYTKIKKLGEGAFGEVYEVEDSNGNRFALKSIRPREGDSSAYSYYLDAEREFVRGQLLDHPNIIKSFDFFNYTDPTGRFSKNVVLQLVEGKTLYSTPRKFLVREQAITAASQFCDAIDYALSLNLLHLDLHHGNVMISDNADAMIIDLASFFTYDELFSYVREQYSSEYSDESTNESTKLQVNALLQVNAFAREDSKKVVAPERGRKIKEFFMNNPDLLAQIQKGQQKSIKNWADRKINIQSASQNNGNYSNNSPKVDRTPLESYYFDRVTDVCMHIISKSDIEREEKVNIQAEIKKLAWYYQEDVQEKNSLPIHFYLNQLLEVLQTL